MQCSAKCFYQGFAAQIRSSRLVNTHQNIRPAFLYSRNILNILDKYKFIKSLSTILKQDSEYLRFLKFAHLFNLINLNINTPYLAIPIFILLYFFLEIKLCGFSYRKWFLRLQQTGFSVVFPKCTARQRHRYPAKAECQQCRGKARKNVGKTQRKSRTAGGKKKKSASWRLSRGIEIDDVLLPPLAGATVYYIVFMAFTFCWSGAKFSMLPWLDKQKLPFSPVQSLCYPIPNWGSKAPERAAVGD